MDRPHNQERIINMHQMLFEMARGNFNYRIPLSSTDDALETLVVLINMVAEEMKESIFYNGYITIHSTNPFVPQTTFILDSSFLIQSFTPEVIPFLGYSESNLVATSLAHFVTNSSLERMKKALDGSFSLPTTVTLDFTTKTNLFYPVSCSIGRLINRPEIVLNLVTPLPQNTSTSIVFEKNNDNPITTRKVDALLIQKLYDYILAHLEEPLSSLKELSRQFGTNEHKLKNGFRYFFKTSIYQFYNEQRLKRAYFMIENTSIPLKNISVMNGFNNYPNFSKSFKKQFGFPPYALKRKDFIPNTLPKE